MKKYRLDVLRYDDPSTYKARPTLIGHIFIEALDEDAANEIGQMFTTEYDEGTEHLPSAPFIEEYSATLVEELGND